MEILLSSSSSSSLLLVMEFKGIFQNFFFRDDWRRLMTIVKLKNHIPTVRLIIVKSNHREHR
ncbi:hypothetical protein DERF_003928 [Dermatophagoides farinae]|uniref:Uncharacterized protein n=1 Tax=Dermatophagoides farinae TaxID=6954 RepID=A0A922LBX7_DERFA|nr:hypothetical protein DERF_003928 [Dermatophagoides farinae]